MVHRSWFMVDSGRRLRGGDES